MAYRALGALIIAYTMLGVPYSNFSIKAPIVGLKGFRAFEVSGFGV